MRVATTACLAFLVACGDGGGGGGGGGDVDGGGIDGGRVDGDAGGADADTDASTLGSDRDACGGEDPECQAPLTCVSPNVGEAAGPGVCALVVTVAELLADPAAFAGRAVAVLEGTIAPGDPECTTIACGPQNPCCNDCTSIMTFGDDSTAGSLLLRYQSGLWTECAGSECDLELGCPYPVAGIHRVIGEVYASFDDEGINLRVDFLTTQL